MTEQEFRTEQRQLMEAEIENIKDALISRLEKSFNSGAIPDEWKSNGDHRTKCAVIDSFCRDRPYEMWSDGNRANAENIHLFL